MNLTKLTSRLPLSQKLILNTILWPAGLIIFIFTLLLAAVPAAAEEDVVLLDRGHQGWRYWDKGERPPKEWNTKDFDDTAWSTGAAPLGYGEDDIATTISFGEQENNKHPVAFFRFTFQVDAPDVNPVWIGELRCDDGAAVYLNGKSIYRYNMPDGDLTEATFASGTLSGLAESSYHAFYVEGGYLKAGENVLAISVHQANAGSSDLVMDFALKGGPEASNLLAGHSMHGEVFNEGARQKAYLIEGCGDINFPATTENELVQKFINQGLGQMHGFWFYESERSFRQAAALDPDCAIAYWGMAYANVPVVGFYRGNEKRAKGFIKEAMARRDNASKREQMYIDALNTYLNTDANKRNERGATYVRALEKILYEYPDDVECRSLMVLHMYTNRRQVKINHTAIDAVMQQVFERSPMHPTHHYRIHLWDYERHQVAVDSAAKCGPSAPGIAHMWHMGGHIFSKQRRYNDAAWLQEASARVDHAHMIRDGVLPDQIHNFAHNNEWLVRNLNNVGRVRDAISLAANMIELPRHPRYNTTRRRGSTMYGRIHLFETLRRFEKWQALIEYCNSPYLEPTDNNNEADKRLRYLAMAHFRLGDIKNGDKVLNEFTARLDEQKAKRDKAVEEAKTKKIEELKKKTNTKKEEPEKQDVTQKKDEEVEKKEVVAKKKDQAALLLGKWRMTEIQQGGNSSTPPAEMMLTIEKDTMLHEGPGRSTEFKYHVDAKNPGHLDMDNSGRMIKMLYKIDGDQLKLISKPPGDERPISFETDGGYSIQVLERVETMEQKTTDESQTCKEVEKAGREAGKPFGRRIQYLDRIVTSLQGHREWAEGNFEKAYELLKKAGREDRGQLARVQFLAGKQDEAITSVTEYSEGRKNQVQPLSILVELLWKAGKKEEAKKRFESLRTVAGHADLGASPVLDRLTEAAKEFGYPSDWRKPKPLVENIDKRVPLSSLGPFRWSPSDAPVWTLADADGNQRSMKEFQDRPVVMIFYLGFGCLHCVEQLQAFAPEYEAFREAGLDVIAISSDKAGGLAKSLKYFDKEKLPIPLLSDPSLEVFKRYRCFDDFENMPLHGTFVISPDGKILWQDISYEPFMDPKFVLNEGKRLLKQHKARTDRTTPAESRRARF